jgi:transcriptional regulator with XRE-family HTH domain
MSRELDRRQERKCFRDSLKIFLKLNGLRQSDISDSLGLTKPEFSNFLSGRQSSSPSNGIDNYNDFKESVAYILGDGFKLS